MDVNVHCEITPTLWERTSTHYRSPEFRSRLCACVVLHKRSHCFFFFSGNRNVDSICTRSLVCVMIKKYLRCLLLKSAAADIASTFEKYIPQFIFQ